MRCGAGHNCRPQAERAFYRLQDKNCSGLHLLACLQLGAKGRTARCTGSGLVGWDMRHLMQLTTDRHARGGVHIR